ncbi:class I SAM-dependent methyltransferase [Nitrospira japonica]|nr:class I SAM-dependent methyltransferase [Nitrospira japonica]
MPLLPQAAYDRWSGVYDDADPSTSLDEPFLLAMVTPFTGCRILDLGCGTGRYLRLVNQPGASVVGMDLSQGMLVRAMQTLVPKASIAWVQASFERFPFADGSFDRVISGLILDHVHDLRSFFHQIAAVLRPGGRLILSAVHPMMQRLTGATVRFVVQGQEYHVQGTVHEVETIAESVQEAGLDIENLLEPEVDQELIARYPVWRARLGCPALMLLAAHKTG